MPDDQGTDRPNLVTTVEVMAQRDAAVTTNPKWYFDGSRFFFKFLRLLNLLEPDRVVLSMTKVMLWGATIQSILVISTSSDWLTVSGALGMNVATMLKHETRRKAQANGGNIETRDGE